MHYLTWWLLLLAYVLGLFPASFLAGWMGIDDEDGAVPFVIVWPAIAALLPLWLLVAACCWCWRQGRDL